MAWIELIQQDRARNKHKNMAASGPKNKKKKKGSAGGKGDKAPKSATELQAERDRKEKERRERIALSKSAGKKSEELLNDNGSDDDLFSITGEESEDDDSPPPPLSRQRTEQRAAKSDRNVDSVSIPGSVARPREVNSLANSSLSTSASRKQGSTASDYELMGSTLTGRAGGRQTKSMVSMAVRSILFPRCKHMMKEDVDNYSPDSVGMNLAARYGCTTAADRECWWEIWGGKVKVLLGNKRNNTVQTMKSEFGSK